MCFRKGGTTPIRHAGRWYRLHCLSCISFLAVVKPSWFECNRQSGGRGSGSKFEIQAVDCQASAAEEKQRSEVLRHQRKDRGRQRNLKGLRVASGEIMNHAGEKHVQKAAANLVAAVRSRAARELHLRNRLAAKGALPQMRRHGLAAKDAADHVRGGFSQSAHAGLNLLFLKAMFVAH